MKLFKIVLVAIAALISLTKAVAGARDAACFLPDSVNGFGALQCRAHSVMWSYRATANRCVRFIYGGCGGNRNQFSTQRECENICKK
uniref:BPTI/Kunitz inhibitor domain-containing protein n=1 Tax=Glossina morsitans morsitans TaxID=37546 RepID=A0A1B0FLH6_GLOMM